MRHRTLTAALGFLVAATLIPTGQAQAASADPTGIWRKAQQGEHPGKIEVFRCGSGKRYICAKIIWLKNPIYKGRPLIDVRNGNPSMRGRKILGLQIIKGMAPSGPNVWKGNIYNPEDGNTYSATLTLVSRNKINLKGCKGWILCGERTWLRTSLPKPEPKPEPKPQIEASAEPEAVVQPVVATASAEPRPKTLSEAEMLTPAVQNGTRPGFRFLNGSAKTESNEFSGENVPSMFGMASLIVPQPTELAPTPKPQNMQATAAPAARPATAAPAAAVPTDSQAAAIETAETENAEVAIAREVPLSRRQRRLLRRQQKREGLLPWQR